jgi:FecR-like protein
MRRAMVILLILIVSACGKSSAPPGSAASGQARLTVRNTAVDVKRASDSAFAPGKTGASFDVGDSFRTDATGFAQLDYPDGSLTRLDVSTTFTLTKLASGAGRRSISGKLDVGRTWNRVAKVTTSGGFEVATSNAVAAVAGTTFIVSCSPTQECVFSVVEGTVVVTTKSGKSLTLHTGESVTVSADGNLGPIGRLDFSGGWVRKNQPLDAALPAASSAPTGAVPTGQAMITYSGGIVEKDAIPIKVSSVQSVQDHLTLSYFDEAHGGPTFELEAMSPFMGAKGNAPPPEGPTIGLHPRNGTVSVTNNACTITIEHLGVTDISGRFECPALRSGTGQVVQVAGSFDANIPPRGTWIPKR